MAVSREVRQSLSASSTDEDAILLVVLTDPSWAESRRYASHGPEYSIDVDGARFYTLYDGEIYDHSLISVPALPDDRENEVPSVSLAFENVEQDMGALVDMDTDAMSIDLLVISRREPRQLLAEFLDFDVLSADADDESLTLEIGFEGRASEPAIAWRMDKRNVPGLHR